MKRYYRTFIFLLVIILMHFYGCMQPQNNNTNDDEGDMLITLIDENFDGVVTPANFGFDKGSSVIDNALVITRNMQNYAASVKIFNPEVMGQYFIDLSFDWKTNFTVTGISAGIEFRDLYGRLIFALASGSNNDLWYSTTGQDSNSNQCADEQYPEWTKIKIDINKTYTVHLQINFKDSTVSYFISEKGNSKNIVAVENANTSAANLAKMIACNYYTSGAAGGIIIDNFLLKGANDIPTGILKGKTMYAFGDSIVAGHLYTQGSFPNFVALCEGMKLNKYSANGATIMSAVIWTQVYSAPSAAPDFIVFNGGTNDASTSTVINGTKIGSVSVDFENFDKTTFAGSFENTLLQMKTKWPNAKIVYVAVHKLCSRDWNTQEAMHKLTKSICEKWDVVMADVYCDTILDTRDNDHRIRYTFDNLGDDGLPGHPGTINSSAASPSGTHPNLWAIEKFYTPVVSAALQKAAQGSQQ